MDDVFIMENTLERLSIKVIENLLDKEKAIKRNVAKQEQKIMLNNRNDLLNICEADNNIFKFASKFSNSIIGLIK
jgi:hypothetical protein